MESLSTPHERTLTLMRTGMQRYLNRSGNSAILAYKLGSTSITVQFVSGTMYLYTYESTGAANVELMKQLAASGRGLSSFISTTVRDAYEQKIG